jgi:hypothetical protein
MHLQPLATPCAALVGSFIGAVLSQLMVLSSAGASTQATHAERGRIQGSQSLCRRYTPASWVARCRPRAGRTARRGPAAGCARKSEPPAERKVPEIKCTAKSSDNKKKAATAPHAARSGSRRDSCRCCSRLSQSRRPSPGPSSVACTWPPPAPSSRRE